MPFFRFLLITASLSLPTGGLMAAAPQNEGQLPLLVREQVPAAVPEVASSTETASVAAPPSVGNKLATNQAPFQATPYSRSYQTARQSHDELIRSMQVRRDALHQQMQKRRSEIARERAALAKQRPGSVAAGQEQRNWQQQAKMLIRQKKLEEEIMVFRHEMEARIDDGINAIGRPGYAYPYGLYMYPGRY
ncbi:hypothetical protein [Thiolapillus sp.]